MNFQCRISYRVGKGGILSWVYQGNALPDHSTVAAEMIAKLRRIKRRPITIVGVTVLDRDAQGDRR